MDENETPPIPPTVWLESFLKSARPVGIHKLHLSKTSFHQLQSRLLFEGGIIAQAKPVNGVDHHQGAHGERIDGNRVVNCEIAAWVVARELGWTDLVPTTVGRRVPALEKPDPDGQVYAAVQVVIPDVEQDLDGPFRDEDVDRAAVFDYLIGQTDRRARNWLLFGKATFKMPARLILVDHGLAFDAPGVALSSRFYTDRAGQSLSQPIIEALRKFVQAAPESELRDLLEPEAFSNLMGRAQLMLDDRRVPFAADFDLARKN